MPKYFTVESEEGQVWRAGFGQMVRIMAQSGPPRWINPPGFGVFFDSGDVRDVEWRVTLRLRDAWATHAETIECLARIARSGKMTHLCVDADFARDYRTCEKLVCDLIGACGAHLNGLNLCRCEYTPALMMRVRGACTNLGGFVFKTPRAGMVPEREDLPAGLKSVDILTTVWNVRADGDLYTGDAVRFSAYLDGIENASFNTQFLTRAGLDAVCAAIQKSRSIGCVSVFASTIEGDGDAYPVFWSALEAAAARSRSFGASVYFTVHLLHLANDTHDRRRVDNRNETNHRVLALFSAGLKRLGDGSTAARFVARDGDTAVGHRITKFLV